MTVPIASIAVSTGQNDSGTFELNFRDERYIPFEGAGAISKWRLELPSDFRQFDYDTISDAILHLRNQMARRVTAMMQARDQLLLDVSQKKILNTGELNALTEHAVLTLG